ncbi:glycosyl hydrolase family 61 [Trichoderma arundinaceum]|uniref:lytic cellulose monooxygenase (C4-dehydrogenating) n=1 Tax=Trichoderma arundinaceum TaxID=490622 RepID=A0A395NPH1_TRIAR|nr:glycosyl hydrolase family 61 [Trichoderma arundinaceum]
MKSSAMLILTALGCLAGSVLGHGQVQNFTLNGAYNQGFILDYYYQKVNTGHFPNVAGWYAEGLDLGFIAPDAYTTPDIICHKNSAPGAITATIPAGGTIVFQWGPGPWPHPYGPVITYVAQCSGSCTNVDKTSLRWVKIQEQGINLSTQVWASQVLINQGGRWSVKVPSSLKAGNYVFRHEILAAHGATSANGMQNYPQCVNVAVTGSGTKSLPAGVPATSLYKPTDPGILFNPYTTITNYTIPGPALWVG